MSSASARSSTPSGGPGGGGSVRDGARVETELVQRGNLVGEESLEWSLNFLTRNSDFLNERSMSPLSIYAVHVWTGSQGCDFVSKLSFQGKIRNALFKLLIHPIHELVNSLKTNAYYNAALSSEKPFDFDQSISSCRLEIPLISGKCYDGDFILSQMKWVYKLFQTREEAVEGETLSSELVAGEESFADIAFPDSLKEFSRLFCSKVVFHWLAHHILANFLYNPNGPISLLSFNVLIEKLSPFFSKHSDSLSAMFSDILAFSDSVWEVWASMKEKSSAAGLLSVANSLEKCTSDSEEFMKSLSSIALKYPLDELLDNLSELIIAINDALPCADVHAPRLPTPARPNTSPVDATQKKSIPPDADPREPFNSIFEATGFRRAMSVCREFPDLLGPKESYSEKVIRTTRLVLNYCLRNSLADLKYVRGAGSGEELAEGVCGSRQEAESGSLEDRGAATDEREGGGAGESGLKRKGVFREDLGAEEEGPKRQNLYSSKGRVGRKISVRGFSESSDSSEEATPRPRPSETIRSGEQQPTVVKRESARRRASASPAVCMSRQYRRWSDEETSLLIDGVNKFGLGKWRAILVTTKLTNRDEVGLKDRWRNLIKGGHVMWDSKTKRYRSVKE